MPAALPGALHRRRRPARDREVPLRPGNPSPTKFPPYYDNSVILGEFTQDTLREIKLDSQNRVFKINSFLDCGQVADPAFLFECDNPMDMQWGADGSFYLLTYGDGFFAINPDAGMYQWDYVKGTRAPKAVLTTDKTDGALPLTVNFSSAGSSDDDPATRSASSGTSATAPRTRSTPTRLTRTRRAGRYTAVLTVTDSSGKSDDGEHGDHGRQHEPTVVVTTPVDGGTFAFGDSIPFTSWSPTRRTGRSTAPRSR